MRARTEIYYRAVRELRFPALAAKEKAFRAAVKSVMKGDSGIEVRAPDHFEQEGIFLQAHIRDADALARVEKKVGELKKQSAALFDTLL